MKQEQLKKFPKNIYLFPDTSWWDEEFTTDELYWSTTKDGDIRQKYIRADVVKKMVEAAIMKARDCKYNMWEVI